MNTKIISGKDAICRPVNKLVRDRIVEVIEAKGHIVGYHIISVDSYLSYLQVLSTKLIEELSELGESIYFDINSLLKEEQKKSATEELADVSEVMETIEKLKRQDCRRWPRFVVVIMETITKSNRHFDWKKSMEYKDLCNVAKNKGINMAEVEEVKREKRARLGGFDKGIFLEYVIDME